MNIEFRITLWALACAYALGNSFIYSWTFWTAFDINILQFASITDLIPSIIYNLILPFAIVVLTVVSSDIWVRLNEKIETILDGYLSPYIENYDKIKIYAGTLTSIIFAIAGIIAAIYSTKSLQERVSVESFPWLEVLKLLIPIVLIFGITHFIIAKTTFILDIKYRTLIIFCICLVPAASYFWAVMNSKKIINGKDTFLVKSDTQCKSTPDTQFRYISSISDKAFALSLKDGSVCIFKYNTLELIPESKKHFTVALDSKAL